MLISRFLRGQNIEHMFKLSTTVFGYTSTLAICSLIDVGQYITVCIFFNETQTDRSANKPLSSLYHTKSWILSSAPFSSALPTSFLWDLDLGTEVTMDAG
ncbi:hypothetical protein ILYODFUR_011118 [Ilyodon furcidens]|uniref:Uncharacterized protein n=1 Tax=Ilyodon furcidens TaxID=33524 RepID=A0ABV0USF1_9TELE